MLALRDQSGHSASGLDSGREQVTFLSAACPPQPKLGSSHLSPLHFLSFPCAHLALCFCLHEDVLDKISSTRPQAVSSAWTLLSLASSPGSVTHQVSDIGHLF